MVATAGAQFTVGRFTVKSAADACCDISLHFREQKGGQVASPIYHTSSYQAADVQMGKSVGSGQAAGSKPDGHGHGQQQHLKTAHPKPSHGWSYMTEVTAVELLQRRIRDSPPLRGAEYIAAVSRSLAAVKARLGCDCQNPAGLLINDATGRCSRLVNVTHGLPINKSSE